MAFSDHKITAFTHKITDLPDQPNLPADELKARFDSSPEELRQAHNALCDDADRLDDRVSGIIAETFGDTITEDMLSDELINNVAWKSDLYYGSYTGNGIYPRTISLGFQPRMVFVMRANGWTVSTNYTGVFLAVQREVPTEESYCWITENGFMLRNEGERSYLNLPNAEYVYCAIK